MTNQEKIDLIIDDLEKFTQGNDYNCSMQYAFNNGYHLHAASLWMSTGAMSEEIEDLVKGVKINRKKEMAEIKKLCDEAYIYVCNDCNHHEFLEFDDGVETYCPSCGKTCSIQLD
jgi:rubrerythrin